MSLFPQDIVSTAKAIIRDFKAAGLMVSTAESCTGGLIAGALTEISGSSAVVDRGFVTYTNSAKIEMLGVQAETLLRFGAVSEETARQMVHGALFRSRADIAVAVTGIAGPGGGSRKNRSASCISPPNRGPARSSIGNCSMAISDAARFGWRRSGRRWRWCTRSMRPEAGSLIGPACRSCLRVSRRLR